MDGVAGMSASQLKKTSALSALAAGLAIMAMPAAAWAQDEGHHHGGGGAAQAQPAPQGGGAPRGGNGNPAPAPARVQPAPAAPAMSAPRANPWQGRYMQGGPGNQGTPMMAQPNAQPAQQRGNPMWRNSVGGSRNFGGEQRGGQAQGRDDGGDHRGDRGQWHGDHGQPRGDQGQQGGHRGETGQWRGDIGVRGGDRGGDHGQWRGQQAHGQYADRGGWSHDWRRDQRYDWRGWRDENRDVFHAGRYYAPYRGYYYNRLSIGFALQPLFYNDNYWITDTDYYRLPPAYGPYHWVRYYDDVLLVNVYSGAVVDVIYDFFW
jgi:hypothetical protein